MHESLLLWAQRNHEATRAQDRSAMARIAREFDGYVGDLLKVRRAVGVPAGDDITTHLLQERVLGRRLWDEEIVSILRNWAVGEAGTISAAVRILVQYLCGHVDLQQQLGAQPRCGPMRSKRSCGFTGDYRLDRDPAANLLYGGRTHIRPGAPLARMELCVVLVELLARASRSELIADRPASAAVSPVSGFSTLPVRIR